MDAEMARSRRSSCASTRSCAALTAIRWYSTVPMGMPAAMTPSVTSGMPTVAARACASSMTSSLVDRHSTLDLMALTCWWLASSSGATSPSSVNTDAAGGLPFSPATASPTGPARKMSSWMDRMRLLR